MPITKKICAKCGNIYLKGHKELRDEKKLCWYCNKKRMKRRKGKCLKVKG